MLSVWMVRHGETDWNRDGRIQGWADVPMNAAGIDQAKRLACLMMGVPFQALYSSDLLRARTTAAQLSEATGLHVCPNSLLRERGFGAAEGLTRSQIADRFPHGIPGRESLDSVLQRVRSFLNHVLQHGDGRILAVTHGGFIRQMLKGMGLDDVPPLANTSVTKLVFDGSDWQPEVISWAGHLTAEERSHTLLQFGGPASEETSDKGQASD